jgi:hypothetical protein
MRAAAAFAEWMKVHCLIKSYRENDEMIVLHCAETFAGACFSKQPIAYRSRISSKIINKQKGFFLPDPLSQDLKFPNFPAKKSLKKIIFTIVENQYRKNFFLLKN